MSQMTLDPVAAIGAPEDHAPEKPKLDHGFDPRTAVTFFSVLALSLFFVAYSLYVDITESGAPATSWLPFLLLGVALFIALGFEFVNGFHDTANAVATVIYTHSMPAPIAVVWSGLFNFLGVMVSSGAVAFGIVSLLPVELILAGRYRDQGNELRRVRWILSRLRREARADRSALSRLPAHLPHAVGTDSERRLESAVERFSGVAQDLELVEERARLMQEEIAARLNEQTNRTLYVLSVVTAALLPITLITGVFGMNVGGLPWLEHPHGFRHVMSLMLLMVLVALGLIRRGRVF